MKYSPTCIGRLVTRNPRWHIEVTSDQFEIAVKGRITRGCLLRLDGFKVEKDLLWSKLILPSRSGLPVALGGLPNHLALELQSTIARNISCILVEQQQAVVAQTLPDRIAPLLSWAQDIDSAVRRRFATRGWLDHDFIERQLKSRPKGVDAWLCDPVVKDLLAAQPHEVHHAIDFFKKDLVPWFQGLNSKYEAKCLNEDKAFFDNIEKSPLTDEQRKAVICFDSRVLLVASAGSGKTSTMVAKAAYALKRGFFKPGSIVMLAFNNDAAAELRHRLKERLNPHGLAAENVTAKTFHSFGLEVIGLSTGKKPTVAPWIENGQELSTLLTLVDALKDNDTGYRARWDLFRVVLAQDLPEFGKEEESPDAWCRQTSRKGFKTLNNEVVKSRGEQIVANWLFHNGVRYEYEKSYEHDTADASHRQYTPDFYLPDAQAYLEHWAIDETGNPPSDFVRYKEGIDWKRDLHARHGTRLMQTTMADLWSGKVFDKLAGQLTELGVTLDPNPDRPVPGQPPIESRRMANIFRTFQTHMKNNRLSMSDVRQRLDGNSLGPFKFRHQMFLYLFEPIHRAWEQKLLEGGYIDFEDMLNLAAEHIEQGRWQSPYQLVMVDEFQDASQARARLAKALVANKDACLFAVGDDWQSINRFAGADLAVMTMFSALFGPARTMKLETTFRCPQLLCDISSRFVQKNPAQLRKNVHAIGVDVTEPVQIIKVDDERRIGKAVRRQLEVIGNEAAQALQRHKVFVMGRYRKDRDYLPAGFTHAHLDVEFITVHASKGLECDHVILPRMTSETMGFPSHIGDDPVMALVMPKGDGFAFSEERRLFYVALTRAKRSVCLITCNQMESAFFMELVREHQLVVRNHDEAVLDEELCPVCGNGFLVTRNGRHGPYMSCSNFPSCKHKKNFPKPSSGRDGFKSARQHPGFRRR